MSNDSNKNLFPPDGTDEHLGTRGEDFAKNGRSESELDRQKTAGSPQGGVTSSQTVEKSDGKDGRASHD